MSLTSDKSSCSGAAEPTSDEDIEHNDDDISMFAMDAAIVATTYKRKQVPYCIAKNLARQVQLECKAVKNKEFDIERRIDWGSNDAMVAASDHASSASWANDMVRGGLGKGQSSTEEAVHSILGQCITLSKTADEKVENLMKDIEHLETAGNLTNNSQSFASTSYHLRLADDAQQHCSGLLNLLDTVQ